MTPDDRFLQYLDSLFDAEGGYSFRAADRGGETNLGVTDAQDGKVDRMVDVHGDGSLMVPIKELTREQAAIVYRRNFWLPSHAEECPVPLDRLVFDVAVNSGTRCAIRTLQKALGALSKDGAWGPITSSLVKSCNPFLTAQRFLWYREQTYRGIVALHPDQGVFLRGWLNRIAALKKEVGIT